MNSLPRIASVAAAALMLPAPAMWNGFPLLQYDTGGYFARWYEGRLEESRSTVYGAFLNVLSLPDFWPVVIAQALFTVWILWLVLRSYDLGGRVHVLPITVATLSILTALPWLASQLITDVMAGLAVCVSDLREMASVVNAYGVGITVGGSDPRDIAEAVKRLDRNTIDTYKRNALAAARELCWDREADRLISAYRSLLQQAAE